MNNKKKTVIARGLLCTALLFLHANDALAAKARKKQSGHYSPAKRAAYLKRRVQPPPELWSILRARLVLPKPAPVQWPVPMLEAQATLQNELNTPGSIAPVKPNPMQNATTRHSQEVSRTGGAGARRVALFTLQSVRNGAPIKAGRALGTQGVQAVNDIHGTQTTPASGVNRVTEAEDGMAEASPELKRQESAYNRYREQVEWFARRMGFIRHSVARAKPYLYLILEDFDAHKLPLDLALLPILESGYEPRAVSPKTASGIWQFMAGTGRDYGLVQNDWYDGRLDIVSSTRAAGRHLAHLSRKFHGNWLLALAAYNCGEKRVEQAIAANQAADLPTDFWSLQLPEETMAYVPRLLALSTIFSNPQAYGLALQPLPYRPYLVRVRFERKMPVAEVSRLAGLSMEEFIHLNPGFIKDTVAVDGPSELLLPENKRLEFQGRLAMISLTEAASKPILLAINEQIHYCSANPLRD